MFSELIKRRSLIFQQLLNLYYGPRKETGRFKCLITTLINLTRHRLDQAELRVEIFKADNILIKSLHEIIQGLDSVALHEASSDPRITSRCSEHYFADAFCPQSGLLSQLN